MRVLIYKRTHNGDPDQSGRFGINNCMGSVRGHQFDAVIGVGGIGREAQANGIDGQINWIGIGPHKTNTPEFRDPIVTFDHFVDYGTDGPDFRTLAPQLADQIYGGRIRRLIADEGHAEVMSILSLAETAPPSGGKAQQRPTQSKQKKCRKRRVC